MQCLMLMMLLAACGCMRRDPVHTAIENLGGTQAEARQAVMSLRLMSRDPVPELIQTVQNRRARHRIRVKCVDVLGDIARRQQNEEALAFLHELLRDPDPEIQQAAVRGFIDAEYKPAVPDLIAMKKEADAELRKTIEKALRTTTIKLVREVEKQWNAPEAALAAYEDAEELGLDRGLMGYSKAKFLDMRGRTEEADDQFDELGVIRRWWLIGPFPNRQGMGFRQSYPPETEIELDAAYPSTVGTIEWYRMERNLPAGFLDFEAYFVETDNVVGYTMVYLVSDRAQPVEVRAGSDDTLQLYLNHELVWAHEEYRALQFDDDIVEVNLEKGTNTLVFKVCEDWGGWQLMARITGPGDTPLEGVTITLD
jgi:hypothetical protein